MREEITYASRPLSWDHSERHTRSFLPLTARRFPPTILVRIGKRHFSDVGDHLREFGLLGRECAFDSVSSFPGSEV